MRFEIFKEPVLHFKVALLKVFKQRKSHKYEYCIHSQKFEVRVNGPKVEGHLLGDKIPKCHKSLSDRVGILPPGESPSTSNYQSCKN